MANQEREKAGLSNVGNYDIEPAIQIAENVIKNLINADNNSN
ncbi:hypothetical protein [Viridibacillus arvi]